MRRQLIGLSAGVVMPLLIALGAAAAEYPEMKLRYAHFLTPSFPGSQVDQWFADEIKKRSGGKIEIEIFWAGALGKPTELLDLVSSGAVDLAAIGTSYYPSEMPLSGIVQAVPRVFEGNEEAVRISKGLFDTNKNLQAELQRNKVWPVFWHSLAGYRPLCKNKVEKVEDFKGLKMRAWGEFVPQLWSALGGTPVNVLPGEIYEALQRGTLDCAFWAYDLLYAGKLYEVAKYTMDVHFGAFVNYPVMVNYDKWHNAWPENVKLLFRETGQEAMERDIALVQKEGTDAVKDMTTNHGVTVVTFKEPAKLNEVLPDLTQVWIDKMAQKGLKEEATELITTIEEKQKAMQ
jgi:TRAP-type C4-dicarboxylate transport system substrate-binding protein